MKFADVSRLRTGGERFGDDLGAVRGGEPAGLRVNRGEHDPVRHRERHAGSAGHRAAAAVPSLSTLRIMLVTRNVVTGLATSRATTVLRLVTSLPPLMMRAMCCSERSMPPLGNSV